MESLFASLMTDQRHYPPDLIDKLHQGFMLCADQVQMGGERQKSHVIQHIDFTNAQSSRCLR